MLNLVLVVGGLFPSSKLDSQPQQLWRCRHPWIWRRPKILLPGARSGTRCGRFDIQIRECSEGADLLRLSFLPAEAMENHKEDVVSGALFWTPKILGKEEEALKKRGMLSQARESQTKAKRRRSEKASFREAIVRKGGFGESTLLGRLFCRANYSPARVCLGCDQCYHLKNSAHQNN